MNAKSCLSRALAYPGLFSAVLVLIASTGLLAPTSVGAEITTNVDDRAKVRFSRVWYDWRQRVFKAKVKVVNISSGDIPAPVRLVVTRFKDDRFSIDNADGVTAAGHSYIDIDLPGNNLGVGEASNRTLITFKKKRRRPRWKRHSWRHSAWKDADDAADQRYSNGQGNKGWGDGKGWYYGWYKRWYQRWDHNRFPVRFNFDLLGGSSVGTTAPTSNPFALSPESGDVAVVFRSNLLTEGGAQPGSVYLRNLTTGEPDIEMLDDGNAPDITAGDGIYLATQSVNTGLLTAGDCLTYVSATTSAQGFEIVSDPYDLCATHFPLDVAPSNTNPDNRVSVGAGTVVGDEVLINAEGLTEEDILALADAVGGEVVGTLLPLGIYQLQFPQTLGADELNQIIDELENSAGVDASLNFIGRFDSDLLDDAFAAQHGLQLISSDSLAAADPKRVWDADGADAAGIVVTVIDSGVQVGHPDLDSLRITAEISAGYNTDILGHGTQMAGIIGAITNNPVPPGSIGAVAPQVTIESIKISDSDPTKLEMIAGLNEAAGVTSSGDVVLAAFSIYGTLLPGGMCSAINTIISGGGVVIGSVGNDNDNSGTGIWPAKCNDPAFQPVLAAAGDVIATTNLPHYIVIGATNCNAGDCPSPDSREPTSNHGAAVDLSAPGANVPTTTAAGLGFTTVSGTSPAAAFTAGAAAVLRGCGVTYDQVFNTLDLGAVVTVDDLPNRINLYAALASENTDPTAVNLSNSTIDENLDASTGRIVGDLTTNDTTVCDRHTYPPPIGGADIGSFSVNANQLVLTAAMLDHETKSSYSVTIQSVDNWGGVPASQNFNIVINDLDEAPSISPQVRSIFEHEPVGTNVGAPITASDEDAGASLSYAITSGNIGGAFSIDGSGQITVANSAALDFVTNPSFSLTVEVTDIGDSPPLSSSATVTVNLNMLPDTLPDPILAFDRVEDGVNSVGDSVRRWYFDVTNAADYPASLFIPTSAYGPCGLNPTPSRTWIDFFNGATDARIYGFCAISDPTVLVDGFIWFGALETAPGSGVYPPPPSVYIKFIDRSTLPATELQSNTVSGLPNP